MIDFTSRNKFRNTRVIVQKMTETTILSISKHSFDCNEFNINMFTFDEFSFVLNNRRFCNVSQTINRQRRFEINVFENLFNNNDFLQTFQFDLLIFERFFDHFVAHVIDKNKLQNFLNNNDS